MSSFKRSNQLASRVVSACVAGMLVIGAGAASAREEFIEWRHPQQQSEEVVRFEVLVGASAGEPSRIEGVGLPQPSGSGIFANTVTIADADSVWVAVRAVGPTGLRSPTSDWQYREGTSSESGSVGDGGGSSVSGMPPGSTLSADAGAALQFDFEGGDLGNWLSTGALSSLQEDPGLFALVGLDTNRTLSTSRSATNFHNHYVGANPEMSNVVYSGRMGAATADGGVGVTAYSQFPAADIYYRLRGVRGGEFFEIAAHPASALSCGDASTGIKLAPGIWYEFELSVQSRSGDNLVTAKVWPQGSVEPSVPQVTCTDTRGSRPGSGKVGVWSMGSGERFWDDLQVRPLGATGGGAPLLEPPVLLSD